MSDEAFTTRTMPSHGPSRASGVGIAALIVGIISLLLAISFCASWLGALLGLVGLILGIVGLAGARRDASLKRGLPLTGTILSAAALLIGLVITVVTVLYAGELARWSLRTDATQEANQIAEQARQHGVDEATIAAARARLDAVLDAVPSDLKRLEQSAKDVEAAVDEFEQALQNAAAGDSADRGSGAGDGGGGDDGGGAGNDQ